ncbi:MAG TPA: ATP-dependent 6-phosphofructokinase [Thermoanaerobaculia bacterium]|nr:ATP-dependent 6-phosphofructokinase [Thermoanaerobaculia bacterium]
MPAQRLGILTGGGDAPGLNAVLRAVVRTAEQVYGAEVVGVLDGFAGLIERRFRPLSPADVRHLIGLGGTVLGTTNRANPFAYPTPGGGTADRSAEVVETLREVGLDTLIVIGGDGTLAIAGELAKRGVQVVAVPKTIDNDLAATDYTFGFWTAIEVATDALDRLRDTAESHHRVMLLEVMGRHAGWIALHAGITGAADVILIPEIPYAPEWVSGACERCSNRGRSSSIVVVAEGAVRRGGDPAVAEVDAVTGQERLGGAAERLKGELRALLPAAIEVRATVLGHLQRGGRPVPFDRLLATLFGERAAHLAMQGRSGRMVRLENGRIGDVELEQAVGASKTVDPGGEMVRAARALGIAFGDEA